MVEIMPFGKYKDNSVEQIVLKDYKYFTYILNNIPIKKRSLDERFSYVDHVVNNFKSVKECAGCDEPAKYISVYHNYHMNLKISSLGFIYCSYDCFEEDPNVTVETNKITFEPLKFKTAISSTKFDTHHLIKLMSTCMGLKEGRKTKEYLSEFFDEIECW